MELNKKKVTCISAFILYLSSLLLVIGVGLYILLTFIEFILAKEGIGVYGGILYYVAAFFSIILWGVSYWLIPNKKMAFLYWIIFTIFTISIAIQPAWWTAP
jgi:hypothetical protein